jgi:hypothetical protein
MKATLIISLFTLLSSCVTKNNLVSVLSKSENNISLKTPCLEDGTCTIELFKNKSLNVKSDQFGSTYLQQLDAEGTSVIVYHYDRNVPKDLQDGNYREEIIFEIKNNVTTLSLKDKDLQVTKMLYGRFCFCKGQTGYYKVENGLLKLVQKNNIITLDLHFKNNKVPQIIETIKAELK